MTSTHTIIKALSTKKRPRENVTEGELKADVLFSPPPAIKKSKATLVSPESPESAGTRSKDTYNDRFKPTLPINILLAELRTDFTLKKSIRFSYIRMGQEQEKYRDFLPSSFNLDVDVCIANLDNIPDKAGMRKELIEVGKKEAILDEASHQYRRRKFEESLTQRNAFWANVMQRGDKESPEERLERFKSRLPPL